MRFLLSLFLLFSITLGSAQVVSEKEQQEIVSEGFRLYRLELASWNASDLLEQARDVGELDSMQGYLSYKQGNSINTIFYGGENHTRVYVNFVFDSVSSLESAIMDLIPRNANSIERELITIRTEAVDRINRNHGNFYESYDKTSFNLIPMIDAKGRRVVVLTGPKETGNVLFGNDYLLEYTADNKFKSQTRLHRNLIAVPMVAQADSGQTVVGTVHSHADPTSKYITFTDICTLLLYTPFTNWEQHYVVSEKFMSIWDVKKQTLAIISRKALDKIDDGQEKSKSKN